MAAQLKDGGRYPATVKLNKEDFARFVAACDKPSEPSAGLKRLFERVGNTTSNCR